MIPQNYIFVILLKPETSMSLLGCDQKRRGCIIFEEIKLNFDISEVFDLIYHLNDVTNTKYTHCK